MNRTPHRISPEEIARWLAARETELASATTADGTQRKRLVSVGIPGRFETQRRYYEGDDTDWQVIKSTTDLAEAVEAYNRLS